MPLWQPASRAHTTPTTTPGLLSRASSAVALLVVAAISTLMGLFFAIPALLISVIAVVLQSRSDPRSERVARWGWVAYVVGAVLMLLAGVALVVVAGYAASGTN